MVIERKKLSRKTLFEVTHGVQVCVGQNEPTIWPVSVPLNLPTDQELEIVSSLERLSVIWFTTDKHVYVLDKQDIG
jgi:hypothetical protein